MSEEDDEIYDVEAILDRRIKNGYEQTTWEPRSNLNCDKLLREFLDKINPKATETRKKLKQIGDDEVEVASDSNSSSSEKVAIDELSVDSDVGVEEPPEPPPPLTEAKKEFLAKLGIYTTTTEPTRSTTSSVSRSTQHRELLESSQSNSKSYLRKPQLRNPTASIQKKTVNKKELVKKMTSGIRKTQLEGKSRSNLQQNKIYKIRNSMYTRSMGAPSISYHIDNTKDDIKEKLWSMKIPKKTSNEIRMSDLSSDLNQIQDSTSSNTLDKEVIKLSKQKLIEIKSWKGYLYKKEKTDRYIAQIEIKSLNMQSDEKLFATLKSENEIYMDFIITESSMIDFHKAEPFSATLYTMTALSNEYRFKDEIEKLKLGNMIGMIYVPRTEPDDVIFVCASASNLCKELNIQFTSEKSAVIFRMPYDFLLKQTVK
ncbi:5094_t:CDS:2 [Ambispora leptoticha]|uniref:5094_t:CDS:1 n=1 Tax=Ambispora leptoticha TaxID=144679 RepID=A0A9N8Z989_9GLOM|nr:5094_t:CDS:2 [Ambispora leptoticha]